MNFPANQRGIILLAHGSRDPLWKAPIEAIAAHIEKTAPSVAIRCAYLEVMAPDLAISVAELASLGVLAIRVIPLFLGMGKHTREDQQLRMQYCAGYSKKRRKLRCRR